MKTKLTLDKLKSADFLEIIEKDEMESSIGGKEPPPSCVFHCLDFLDGDAFDWQHYSIETHEVLGYWAGSGGEVNASDIPTMGSFGDMEVFEIGDNQISISQQGNITYNGKEYKGMMVFNNDNGQVGHAVVITGTYLNPNTGKTQIKYGDEANQMPGKVDIGAWSTIYAVGEVGSYSAGGSIF